MPVQEPEFSIAPLLERIAAYESLTSGEAEAVFDRMMSGVSSEAETAAFLMGLRVKGISGAELAGGVRALRKAMVTVRAANAGELVDTAGTGGGSLPTFNISTAAALVAAGAGVRVAKHGNRSFTSRSGSADVLEALGVRIDLTPERMGEILDEVGIVFMFAPLLHPAMRHVGPVRRLLGIRTAMNLLGPLTNPAGATRQVVGVSDPELVPLVASAMQELGHRKGLVVHGEPGLDEVSPMGSTQVTEVGPDGVRAYEIHPEELGLPLSGPTGLEGGEPSDNARVIEAVLSGREGAARVAVVLNAAAAVLASGRATDWQEAVTEAEASIDQGLARATLERLRAATRDG